ncbi:hypothetical protein KXQ82_17575 [Mucilaginibacter sp. HMF5004]|uniref:hypothetical protein n=1 Tax=Mucilaginibacter rivuli TaxID=2857527 RepID=UPI001C5F5E19|nr:hypothetical protein [Mucilaginibacter rivuli]MBW4891542.1 hypothetical protein [Mucilaginibacter rivuli]
MTLIASWLNLENKTHPTIWTAADSQISDGKDTLTLEGSKVLELPIRVRDLTTPIQEVYFKSSFGFAYAGSSFTAFNTYSTLSVILDNLGRSKVEGILPSHDSILSKCKDILKHYTIEKSRLAEVSIWGFCPVSKEPFIGVIKQNEFINDYDITIQHGSTTNLKWFLLGNSDAKKKFEELILKRLEQFENSFNSDYWRSPFYPLREIIESKRFGGVGGNIQLSMSTLYSFGHYSVIAPIDESKKSWTLKFRNFDVREDFGWYVGDCLISINGMAMDYPYS